MRPALAMTASTARWTEASSVTSISRTGMGSESFSASLRISAVFLALRPPGSRIVAKTVCPLRASVSVNSLPKPVLEPVIRTTCLEFMDYAPHGPTAMCFDAGSKALVAKNESPTGVAAENERFRSAACHYPQRYELPMLPVEQKRPERGRA